MFNSKVFKNVFGLLLLTGLLVFLQTEIAAQCGGTYFKRLSTNLVPLNAYVDQTADMTGDGIPDLIGRTVDTPQNYGTEMVIVPANGSGGFGSPITINAPANLPFWIFKTGDFDGDNFKDFIALFNTNPQTILVYKNNGNGTFTAQTLSPANYGVLVYLMDINNDGKGDIIGEFSGTDVRYSLGNGDGTFQTPVQFANSNNIFPGDFNSDGKIDFIAKNTLLLNQGGGIFTPVNNALNLGSSEFIREVRDFSGDGKPDILATTNTQSTVKVSIQTNTGSNSFTRTDYTIATNQSNSNWNGNVYVGNFSGNSSPDFIFDVNFLNKTLVYTNDGSGNFTGQTFDYKFNGFLTGDFDNDGKTDLLNISNGNQNGYTHKIFNELSVTIQKNVCTRPGQTRIVDFDRSGSTDYLFWKPSNGLWSYKPSGNTGTSSGSFNWGLGALGDIPTPGDYDGDGITDYAVYRSGTWYVHKSSDQDNFAIQFGVAGDNPVAGDYDGDSVTDIAVWRPSDGNWYILFLGTQSYTIVHWGADGDKPVPEDYDGDGKTDLAIFRPASASWYCLKSSDNNFINVQWGLSTDKPVSADYDGDGKSDIAVYRESENVLYILRSYNFSFAAVPYGVFQDIPQPGDYDGDFVFDFGIYRPINQLWYSFNNGEQINFGGSSVVPASSILRIE